MNTTLETLQAENARLQELLFHQQQQTQQAERRYHQLFDHLIVGSFTTDMQGNLQEYNTAFQQMLGYPDTILLTLSLTDITPEKWHQQDQEIFQTALLPHGTTDLYHKEFTCQDGTLLPVEVRYVLMTDEQGQPNGIRGFVRDITAQRQQEKELRTFKSIVDYSLDSIGFSDAQGKFLYTNPTYQALTGYGEEMNGMSVATLYDPETVDIAGVIGAVLTKGQWQGILPFTRKDKTIFQGQCSIYKVEDPVGGGFLMSAIVRDITEQQRMERELSTFKTLVDRSPDGINVTTMEAEIFYANESFRTMTGYHDAVIGKTIVDIYADNPDHLMAAARQVAEEGSYNGPFTIRKPDGTLVPVATTVYAIPDEQGTIYRLAAIVRDISEFQKQERERQHLQQQIIEAQQAALRELSTPLLPLAKGILAMPLLGTIDSNRAQQVMETLLEGVSSYQAETVILDITGVQIVDTQVANVLIQAAQAVKLLGAQVVLTGIRPMMAQTLVSLGVDLSSIVTRSTLERGIAYVMNE